MQPEYAIDQLCATLAVTRSGYHAWASREPGVRAQANAAWLPLISRAHLESRQTYGSPRVHRWLQQHGQPCGRHRVARLMRATGLRSQARRRFRPLSLTDSNHDLPIAPNRLRGTAAPSRRDTVWVADITYVKTNVGFLYVAGVLDRCTRRCIGWAMSDSLATTLPLAALDMALQQRRPPAGLVHHSDRGVQYASEAYRQKLAAAGVIPSMSRPGNCYDNAAMESFWSTLKLELVYRCVFNTRRQAQSEIFDYIERFYNYTRIHSSLNFRSPAAFETNQN